MPAVPLPQKSLPWAIAWEAVALIATSESCRLKAYRCRVGVWTIGWRETQGVLPGDVWTKEYADERLCSEISRYAAAVQAMYKIPANECQLGTLVSLAHNIGLDGLRKSTVLRQHNAGNHAAAARAFNLWNKATIDGKLTELTGLTRRRAAEAALYLKTVEDSETPRDPVPQAVSGESGLAKSPVAQSGVATIAASVATAATVSEQAGGDASAISTLKSAVPGVADVIGVHPSTLLIAATLAAGLPIVYWRWKQRQ
jgi:lysozyme